MKFLLAAILGFAIWGLLLCYQAPHLVPPNPVTALPAPDNNSVQIDNVIDATGRWSE